MRSSNRHLRNDFGKKRARNPTNNPFGSGLPHFFIRFIFFALLFALPPSRNSDPGSHSRLFSPLPHYGTCLAFLSRVVPTNELLNLFELIKNKNQLLRAPIVGRCSQQLIFFFLV